MLVGSLLTFYLKTQPRRYKMRECSWTSPFLHYTDNFTIRPACVVACEKPQTPNISKLPINWTRHFQGNLLKLQTSLRRCGPAGWWAWLMRLVLGHSICCVNLLTCPLSAKGCGLPFTAQHWQTPQVSFKKWKDIKEDLNTFKVDVPGCFFPTGNKTSGSICILHTDRTMWTATKWHLMHFIQFM